MTVTTLDTLRDRLLPLLPDGAVVMSVHMDGNGGYLAEVGMIVAPNDYPSICSGRGRSIPEAIRNAIKGAKA